MGGVGSVDIAHRSWRVGGVVVQLKHNTFTGDYVVLVDGRCGRGLGAPAPTRFTRPSLPQGRDQGRLCACRAAYPCVWCARSRSFAITCSTMRAQAVFSVAGRKALMASQPVGINTKYRCDTGAGLMRVLDC